MPPYNVQPFASTHPAIDALFTREFAQSQADREAAARAAASSIARAQIGAQSQLAQSQLEEARAQQDYNRLFREREFQARQDAEKVRQGQVDRQLGILEKGTPNVETERERVRIASINAAAQAAAARFKAAYDAALETNLAAGKKSDVESLWLNGLWPGSTKTIDDAWTDPKYPKRQKVEMETWNSVLGKLQKDPELQFVIPDPKNRVFRPAQLDSAGKLIIPAVTTSDSPINPAALGATSFAPTSPVIADASGGPGTISFIAKPDLQNFFSQEAETPAAAVTAPATPAAPQPEYLSPGVRAVRHAAGPSRDVLLLPEDSAIIVRELPLVQGDDRQKAIAYQAMVDQFVKAGRGRYVPRIGAAPSPLIMDTNAPNRAPF